MRFRLLREAYLDDNEEIWDYETSQVDLDNKDIFDITKSEMSGYSDLLPSSINTVKELRYKNLKGYIQMMSPNEYYQECADKIFHKPVSNLVNSRRHDKEGLSMLRDILFKYHRKFPITTIDYAGCGQEGLHRMMIAGDLFGWDTKFPVLIIDWIDQDLHKQREVEKVIDRVLTNALKYKYSNMDEFKEQIEWELDDLDIHNQDFDIDIKDDKITMMLYDISYTVDNTLIMEDINSDDSDIDIDDLLDMDNDSLLLYDDSDIDLMNTDITKFVKKLQGK